MAFGEQKANSRDPRFGKSFIAQKEAIATPSTIASVVGHNIMQKGGNAIDAMVAVNSTLGVVFPHMTGAGGDAFWLIYDAKTNQQYALNASGRSAGDVSKELYKGQETIEPRGPKAAITVPGAVDGWYQAHKRFGGNLTFKECLQPAIDHAREGFSVSRSLAKFSEDKLDLLRRYETTSNIFLKNGVAPYLEGDKMKNENLATTLEQIAEHGRDAFYKNEIAEEICDYLSKHGGVLTKKDFENHTSDWVKPAEVKYRGKTVIAPPPNSEGMATLQILGMLDKLDCENWSENEAEFIDVFTRATKIAFEDRDHYLDDPNFSKVPLDQLLNEEYLSERSEKIKSKELGPPELGIGTKGDTTFSCAVDKEGNAVGVIQSLYWEWGSGIVAGETGVLLQNRGSFFSLDDNERNNLQPNKRPFHTLTCSMVFNESGKPELVVGAMGGEGEPQTQAAIISRVIDQGYSVQEAIDFPRWLLGRTWGDIYRGLRLEGRYKKELKTELEKLEHVNIEFVEDFSDLVGHAQAIQIFEDHLEAAADPRADGIAIGY